MKAVLEKVLSGEALEETEGRAIFGAMMDGEVSPTVMAAFLAAMRTRGETPQELAALARVMMDRAVRISPRRFPLVDTCGTGGDGQATVNVSTLAALVVAGAGVAVAKHGNRSVSSKCGSADVLEDLGLDITLIPQRVARSIEEVGFGFLFAPLFHPAMAHAAPVRKELGVRTIFNMLGPMVNPAGVDHQVVGVPTVAGAYIMAQAFQMLGKKKVLVIHGLEGLDEVSPQEETLVLEVTPQGIVEETVSPKTFGFPFVPLDEIKVSGREEAVERARAILENRGDPARYVVIMEAGMAIYCAGQARTPLQGVDRAQGALESGRALAVLERAIEFSRRAAVEV
ncbi:MAG: anthranilate phosphoribosyltransferase [Aquificota bacterium]|nr:MAG: anthranilate phosphoribosyltransferase [Aquificota bacterium]